MHVPDSGFRHMCPFTAFCPSLHDRSIVHLIFYWLLWFFLPRLWCRTLRLSCARKPQRSVATVLIVKGAFVYFLVLYLLRLPGCPMFQHSIENGQQLMHTRGQSDFFDFPRGEEPLVKNFDLRVIARGHEGPHV